MPELLSDMAFFLYKFYFKRFPYKLLHISDSVRGRVSDIHFRKLRKFWRILLLNQKQMVYLSLMLVPEMHRYLHIHSPDGCIPPSYLRPLLSNTHRSSGYRLPYIHVTSESVVGVVHEPL